MTDISLSTDVTYEKEKHSKITYHLFEHNHHYAVECYRAHSDKKNPKNYCILENLTEDEEKANEFIQILYQDQVLPLHIADVASDFFSTEEAN